MAVNPIKVWNGTAWEYTGPVVAAPPVKYQATAPTSPATGDVWVESDYDVASVDPSKLLTGGVYTNESTRSAAIPTPTTGMVTYVGDTGTDPSTIPQLETYTGSAWQTPYGLTLVATAPLSGASVQIDNCFSADFDNYQVVLSGVTFSTGAGMNMRIGTSASNTGYYYAQIQGNGSYTGTAVFSNSNANTSSFETGCVSDTVGKAGAVITIQNPFQTLNTTYQSLGSDARTGGAGARILTGFLNDSTSYSGLYFAPTAGTISTGTVRIYGYRNA